MAPTNTEEVAREIRETPGLERALRKLANGDACGVNPPIIGAMTRLVYDETIKSSHGMWVCTVCRSRFHNGRIPPHRANCRNPHHGYAGLEKHFGPLQVKYAIRCAATFGPDRKWYGLSLNDLREHFPELVDARGGGE